MYHDSSINAKKKKTKKKTNKQTNKLTKNKDLLTIPTPDPGRQQRSLLLREERMDLLQLPDISGAGLSLPKRSADHRAILRPRRHRAQRRQAEDLLEMDEKRSKRHGSR